MNKSLKKKLTKLLPKGLLKEKLKLIYYNFFKSKNILFDVLKSNEGRIIFYTKYNNLEFYTTNALYGIVPDFDYYQYFYKVKKNDIVIDAGANVGNISLLFSKIIGQNGKVYCFEPDKFNIVKLKQNFALNSDLHVNWKICDLLLWNENTFIDFQEAGTVGSSAVWFSDSSISVKKQAVRIDDWYKTENLNSINFIKMDIEGAEIEAIEGCIEVIEKFKPNFAIASYHIVNNEPTYFKLEDFFLKINYSYMTIKFRGNEIITFAGPSILEVNQDRQAITKKMRV